MYRSFCYVLALAALPAFNAMTSDMNEIDGLSAKPKHCTYERAYDMYGAHCANLGLSKVPSLRGGIEILDFSKNRLRNINSDTLSSYTSIKFLYLSENHIRHIDEDALTPLTELRTLDLSINSLTMLPDNLLQMPALRKLYLSGNSLAYLDPEYPTLKRPIKAPLEYLDISDCELEILPNFGYLPELTFYNISLNPLQKLEANHFAHICNLVKIDINGAIDKIRLCDLRPIVTWFEEKHVYFSLSDYTKLNTKEFDECARENISVALNATHNRCKSQYQQVQSTRASNRSMVKILGGLAGFLVGFILLLYLTHRWNVIKIKNAEKKKTPDHGIDRRASAILLNDIS